MPHFEIEHTKEHGEFRAIVGGEDDYSTGEVYIQPPAPDLKDSPLLQIMGSQLEYTYNVSTDEATLLDFITLREAESSDFRKFVQEDVDFLLNQLGAASSVKVFIEKWPGGQQ